MMLGLMTGPAYADYWSSGWWSEHSVNALALSDENAVQYQSLAQPFVVTVPDSLNVLVFFGGCMVSPAGNCLSGNRVQIRIKSALNGQPGPVVLFQTTSVMHAWATPRQFFHGLPGQDPEEQQRDDMTTGEVEYVVDLGHTKVSPGTYFLEISGNASAVYAWGWETARIVDTSALAMRNGQGVWTDEPNVANGRLINAEIVFGYGFERATLMFHIFSDQPPHPAGLWQHH